MSYALSLMDRSQIADGSSAEQALHTSVALAQQAELLGYKRYWFAEHHATPQLACSAPELLVAYTLARTQHIRIGSGGIMLRHYAPYKVAETFNLLASLAPGRVDLGVGSAPGGLPASTRALAHGREHTLDYPAQVVELDRLLAQRAQTEVDTQTAIARPLPETRAESFILGATVRSAELAAELGWGFVYAGHFDGDPQHIELAFNAYQRRSSALPVLAVMACAAATHEQAHRLLGPQQFHQLFLPSGQSIKLQSIEAAHDYARQLGVDDYRIQASQPIQLTGNADTIHQQLAQLQRRYGVAEFILDTPISDTAARHCSLALLAPGQLAAA